MDIKDVLELFNTVCIVFLGVCIYLLLGAFQDLEKKREEDRQLINGMGMAVMMLIENENNRNNETY